jgi:hypothetical protein
LPAPFQETISIPYVVSSIITLELTGFSFSAGKIDTFPGFLKEA